jgi:hypothetical protein
VSYFIETEPVESEKEKQKYCYWRKSCDVSCQVLSRVIKTTAIILQIYVTQYFLTAIELGFRENKSTSIRQICKTAKF